MSTRLRLATTSLLLLLTLFGPTLLANAAPRDRKTLVLRGRVTDAEGFPVSGARVTASGSRRARMTVDDAGQFTLDFEFGSLADLARNPVAIRVRAEQKGWLLALPGGEPDLGFDLRVVAGANGVTRCEVRTNEPRVAAAIVRALTTEGDATAVAIASFLGTRGGTIATPAALDLPLVDSVPLPGVEAPVAPPPPVETSQLLTEGKSRRKGESPDGKPSKKKSKQAPEPRIELMAQAKPEPGPKKESKKEEKKKESKKEDRKKEPKQDSQQQARSATRPMPAPERIDPPASVVQTPPPPALPTAAERERAEAKRRADLERTAAREEAKRQRDAGPKRDRMERRGEGEEKPRILDDGTDRRVAEDAPKPGREVQDRRWEALRRDAPVTGSTDTTVAPPVAALTGLAGTPPRAEPRDREIATPRLTARRDTVAVQTPQPAPEPPPPSPWSRVPVSSPGGTPGDGSSRVFPRPEGESRQRSLPLVIRAPGVRPARVDATPATDSCSCRIKGTVEVDSDRPLPNRTRVAISLVWYPAIADTVELFMGSPRDFTLPPAPCGPQRLRLVNLGGMRFDVTSRDAMAGFRCDGGPPREFRVILQPR